MLDIGRTEPISPLTPIRELGGLGRSERPSTPHWLDASLSFDFGPPLGSIDPFELVLPNSPDFSVDTKSRLYCHEELSTEDE